LVSKKVPQIGRWKFPTQVPSQELKALPKTQIPGEFHQEMNLKKLRLFPRIKLGTLINQGEKFPNLLNVNEWPQKLNQIPVNDEQ